MTVSSWERTFNPGDRLFTIIDYICVNADMQQHAFRRRIADPEKQGYALVSKLFDLKIAIPVNGPFEHSFKGLPPRPYRLMIAANDMPKDIQLLKSDTFGGIENMFWNMALVFFFEKYHDEIRVRYGKNQEDNNTRWPEIFRFAWALRNAAAHHGGGLNLTANVRPVEWHHLSYSSADKGLRVFGEIMAPGDMLILITELSNKMDELGFPIL